MTEAAKVRESVKSLIKKAERKQWEYLQVQGGHQVSKMNELGEDGWEVVRIEQGFALFKREKI